jgi:lauroyl/myristoyl acyltransferase
MSKSVYPILNFLHPRHWFSWLSLSIIYLFTFSPPQINYFFGYLLGKLLFYLIPKRKKIAKININTCLKNMNPVQQKKVLLNSYTNLGFELLNIGKVWWRSPEYLLSRTRIDGIQHIYDALSLNKGLIIFSFHATTMEITARVLGHFFPIHILQRHQNNAIVNFIARKSRAKYSNLIERKSVLRLRKPLRNKECVILLPDHDLGKESACLSDFFGHPAYTVTTVHRFAKLFTAPVIFVVSYHNQDKPGEYCLDISKPLTNFPRPDSTDHENVKIINSYIETAILKQPENNIWIHRRFKNQDENIKFYN